MIINFSLVQFVPGGTNRNKSLRKMRGEGDVFGGFAGGSNDVDLNSEALGSDSDYIGARGLPKDFIEELEKEFWLR